MTSTYPSLAHSSHTANADTGTTGHYMSIRDVSVLLDVKPTTTPITVTLPDNTTATSTHIATLNLPQLPMDARRVHLFPNFLGSLLSIGLLCDHGMTAVYTSTTVNILDPNHNLILTGTRSAPSNLWFIDITGPPTTPTSPTLRSAAVITEAVGTKAQIAAFYHAAMGSPSLTTLKRAVSHNYISLPGLSTTLLTKYPPNTIPTAKGHLDNHKHGLRSTHPDPTLDESDSDLHPTPIPRPPGALSVFTKLLDLTAENGTLRHSDTTGRFPIPAKSGAQYVLIMYCGNYIHAETLKSRSASDFVSAYASGTNFFLSKGITPHYERLDNETSTQLTTFCQSQGITIQYVPPHDHRANKAERAIRTWKNHFISILCTCDPDFPFEAWDLLIPQAELTLNLLRSSSFSLNTSAWHSLHGLYVFDHEPIAPPGMKILCFEDPTVRPSWSPHGVTGFYVGPAFNHHRCYTVYIPSTRATRITAQLSWHPPPLYTLPGASPIDDLLSCITNLRASLDNLRRTHPSLLDSTQPTHLPSPPLVSALNALSDIFTPNPNIPPPPGFPPHPILPHSSTFAPTTDAPSQRVTDLPQPNVDNPPIPQQPPPYPPQPPTLPVPPDAVAEPPTPLPTVVTPPRLLKGCYPFSPDGSAILPSPHLLSSTLVRHPSHLLSRLDVQLVLIVAILRTPQMLPPHLCTKPTASVRPPSVHGQVSHPPRSSPPSIHPTPPTLSTHMPHPSNSPTPSHSTGETAL